MPAWCEQGRPRDADADRTAGTDLTAGTNRGRRQRVAVR